MKTIKVIDLLKMIANGEIKLGTKFNWHYQLYDIELIFTEREGALGLYFQREDRLIGLFERFNYQILNDEVEIIEEDKKIEKIEKLNNVGNSKDIGEFKDKQQLNNHILKNKINELIDIVNDLKKEDKSE